MFLEGVVILKVPSSGCVGGVGWWGEDRAGEVVGDAMSR